MKTVLQFYRQWIPLAFGAAASTRALNGTIAIFVLGLYAVAASPWFRAAMPRASAWLDQLPGLITWLPLTLFVCFFAARLALAPYWL